MTWRAERTFGAESVPTLTALRARKAATGATVAAVIAGRVDSPTVLAIEDSIRCDLIGADLVDEVLVHDPRGLGRGTAMRAGVRTTDASIVVFVDGGVRNFAPRLVVRLVAPLLLDDSLVMTKGYVSKISPKSGGRASDHGMARPLLAASYPELDELDQPLSRETAGRASLLRRVRFAPGEGVDVALLIDAFETAGLDAIGQVDLGGSIHRTTPLSHFDGDIAMTVLRRAGERGRARPFADATVYPLLVRDRASEAPDLPPIEPDHAVRRVRPARLARVAT